MDRSFLKDKKRIVVKIGTTTITHVDTGHLNLIKMRSEEHTSELQSLS